MKKLIIGIDPGLKGGVSFFDIYQNECNFLGVHPMPVIKSVFDYPSLKKDLWHGTKENGYSETFVIIESSKINFQGGKKQIRTSAEHIGHIKGLIMGLNLPFVEIQPVAWQKFCWTGITPIKLSTGKVDTKTTSYLAFQRLFPEMIDLVQIKAKPHFHDGLVDATLIGYYGTKHF